MNESNIETKHTQHTDTIRYELTEYSAAHTLDELMTKTLDVISALVDSPIAFLHFVDDNHRSLYHRQWCTHRPIQFNQAEGKMRYCPIDQDDVWADCTKQGKPVIHNDYTSLEYKRGLPEGHAEVIRELVVPIMRKNKVVAVLGVDNKPADYTDQDAEIISYFADVAWELVQRKKSEEALVDSEKRYRRLFESAKDGILILDAFTGKVVDVNPFLTHLLGYVYDDFCGKFIWELGSFKDIASSKEAFDELKKEQYIRYEDLPLKTAYGHIIDVEFISNVYLVDHAKVIQCNIRNITDRKRADAERGRLLTAIEQIGDMIVITDSEGTIQYVNSAFEQITGYTRAEAIGQNPRMLKSGQQNAAFYRDLWEILSSGRTFRGRMVNKRKDDVFFTEEATISPVRNASGQIVNFVAVKHDITDELRIDAQLQQAQKMESIGRLTGGVAHDFNNMLSVIIGYTDLVLAKMSPSEPEYNNLEEVLNAAHRSADITRQLLAFSRKQVINPKVLDLNETVEGILNMLRRLIGDDIELDWLPMSNLWHVKIDPAQIDQILANLCVNARDAIDGVGKLTIETNNVTIDADYCTDHAGSIPGAFVLLTISDDGCGMDKNTCERIFEPFFTTKSIDKGTGFGLSIIYDIVKQNNGFVNVNSEPGKGTTFKVYLPRYMGEEADMKTEKTTEIPSGHGETVLLVDDEPLFTNMVRVMLKRLGYQVLATGTPSEALQLASNQMSKIDLLITDVVMSEMNGRELVDKIHTFDPHLKILFISGYTTDIVTRRGILTKDDNFLPKPFFTKDLAIKIREILD